MSTKLGFWRWAFVGAALMVTSGLAGAAPLERSRVTTTDPAGLLIYPNIKVDPDVCFPASSADAVSGGPGTCSVSGAACTFVRGDVGANISDCDAQADAGVDTLVHLTNTTAQFKTRALCFWINTNGHCDNAPDIICSDEDFRTVCPTGGLCAPGWAKTDFRMTLTKRQPLSWSAFEPGPLPCDDFASQPCDGNDRNEGVIIGVPELPFTGELRCVQVAAIDGDPNNDIPIDQNDFKGEATIITTNGTSIDARKYNAIGIPAIDGANNGDNVLNIGGPDAEYEGCPRVLMLDHFFDGALVGSHYSGGNPTVTSKVVSRVTFVPCGGDLSDPDSNLDTPTTLQFLVYNEYEQRFSSSTKVTCYRETYLSDLDTRPEDPEDNEYSLFSVGVQGTLTGVSHVRPVEGPNNDETDYDGRGILATMQENWFDPMASGILRGNVGGTTANNTHFRGTKVQGSQLIIP